MNLDEKTRAVVDDRVIRILTSALNELVAACYEGDKIVCPTKKQLLEAQKLLPAQCTYSLIKVNETR